MQAELDQLFRELQSQKKKPPNWRKGLITTGIWLSVAGMVYLAITQPKEVMKWMPSMPARQDIRTTLMAKVGSEDELRLFDQYKRYCEPVWWNTNGYDEATCQEKLSAWTAFEAKATGGTIALGADLTNLQENADLQAVHQDENQQIKANAADFKQKVKKMKAVPLPGGE